MKIEILKDSIGGEYIGFNVDKSIIQKHLDKMVELGLTTEIENQQKRDSNKYHITLFNFKNYKEYLHLVGMDVNDVVILDGIGSISDNKSTTYFIPVESNTIKEYTDKDLHITIGFSIKDVFNQRKKRNKMENIDIDIDITTMGFNQLNMDIEVELLDLESRIENLKLCTSNEIKTRIEHKIHIVKNAINQFHNTESNQNRIKQIETNYKKYGK